MKHDFYCRVRRFFRDASYEIWSVEFDYGEGYLAEDKIIIKWSDGIPEVLCFINVKDRMESEEYTSIILALFEDLTDGEGTFELKRIYDTNVEEYDIKDLINKHTMFYDNIH